MVSRPGDEEKNDLDDVTKARLDSLLQGYETALSGRDAVAAEEAESGRTVRGQFVTLRDTVIEPTMREVGEYLKAQGHDYEIRSMEARDVGAGRNDEPSIAMSIFPRGQRRAKGDSGHTPAVTFRAGDAPGRLRTQFVTRPQGGSGDGGHTYALEAVTPDLVRREILELLEAVMRPRGK
jgi:hypothetical protein